MHVNPCIPHRISLLYLQLSLQGAGGVEDVNVDTCHGNESDKQVRGIKEKGKEVLKKFAPSTMVPTAFLYS